MQTAEKSKMVQYSISAIDRRLKNFSIRGDHPLQRESEQWNSVMRNNFIADILHQNPIPAIIIAEQIVDNAVIQWLIDGKQRCTNSVNFKNGLFKVGRNVEKPVISYQTVRMENDDAVYEEKEFDIRGKGYHDLPTELQERFDDYTVSVVQYLNCTDDDIEYHIRRYNTSKPMTAAQKGITHLGQEYAGVVKKLKEHTFFKNCGNYRISEFRNGTMDRLITESIMAINFLPKWKKRNEDICAYLKENARVSDFDRFEEELDRLSEVITDEVSEMFHSKESFLWFALFDRFTKSGREDTEFVRFLSAFQKELRGKRINGRTFAETDVGGTKDKSVVTEKIELLEELMNEYLHIVKEKTVEEFEITDRTLADFLEAFRQSEFISALPFGSKADTDRMALQYLMFAVRKTDADDVQIQDYIRGHEFDKDVLEDTMLYLDILNAWSLETDNNSRIFCRENIPVLLGVVRYAVEQEEDEPAARWFVKYAGNYNASRDSGRQITEKYKKMLASLKRFIAYEAKKSA